MSQISKPITPAHRASFTVLSRIAAARQRGWAYGRARIADWRRSAHSRRLIRISAEIEAYQPYGRG
jgi:hypothetical protein